MGNTISLRNSLRTVGATLALAAAFGTFLAPASHATTQAPPPSAQSVPHPGPLHFGEWDSEWYKFYDYKRNTWCYLEVRYGCKDPWLFNHRDGVYNPHSQSRLVTIVFHCLKWKDVWQHGRWVRVPYWAQTIGSGAENEGLLNFTVNPPYDGYSDLFFYEIKIRDRRDGDWFPFPQPYGTFHKLGHPCEPCWFSLERLPFSPFA